MFPRVRHVRLLATSLTVMVGCSFSDMQETEHRGGGTEQPESVIIVDRTGMEFDITTAVHKYGFDAKRFHHGLGVNAIRPLIEPIMIGPDVTGYPSDGDDFDVVATAVAEDARAYGRNDIIRNEVVDEVFGETPVAVTY
jgi:hypothetical protein